MPSAADLPRARLVPATACLQTGRRCVWPRGGWVEISPAERAIVDVVTVRNEADVRSTREASRPRPRIGLVLGAGGLLGGAWLAGSLATLAEGLGWDPRS